jgi:hypothetical protein
MKKNKKKIIFNLMGGLGNQMFQYAAARAIELELNLPIFYMTDMFSEYKNHNGLELENVFDIKLRLASKSDLYSTIGIFYSQPIIRRLIGKYKFTSRINPSLAYEPHFNFWPGLYRYISRGGYFHGYWQSDRYFLRHAEVLRKEFKFKKLLSEANLNLLKNIDNTESISIHIRRGDYIKTPSKEIYSECLLEYYETAINTMIKNLDYPVLYFFSDDPCWTKNTFEHIKLKKVFIDINIGENSSNDMFLMSRCKFNIISNSTFSWWAAWLNSYDRKIVICPSDWFKDRSINTKDLHPKEWILI